MTLEQMLEDLLVREGRYVDHPADRGGPTNWGITEQVARSYGYTSDMRSLPRETAKAIYRQLYWTRPGFDQVAKTMPRLAEELLDTGVNMGPRTAAIFLQRALNVLNRQAADYPDVVPDGELGPMTINALARLAAKRGVIGAEKVLLQAVDALQGARYIEIAERNPSQEAFAFGWLDKRID